MLIQKYKCTQCEIPYSDCGCWDRNYAIDLMAIKVIKELNDLPYRDNVEIKELISKLQEVLNDE